MTAEALPVIIATEELVLERTILVFRWKQGQDGSWGDVLAFTHWVPESVSQVLEFLRFKVAGGRLVHI